MPSVADVLRSRKQPLLPQEIFYNSPPLVVKTLRIESLYRGLENIGPVPLDETATRKHKHNVIQSGLDQFEGPVAGNKGYRYPWMEQQLYNQNIGYIAGSMRRSIVIEPGIGGTKGGEKLGAVLEKVLSILPEEQWPAAVIGIDWAGGDEKAVDSRARKSDEGEEAAAFRAKRSIAAAVAKRGYPKERIIAVVGDMFSEETWLRVNNSTITINENIGDEYGATPWTVRFAGPILHDFADSKLASLMNYIFDKRLFEKALKARKKTPSSYGNPGKRSVLAPRDGSANPDFLNAAYNNCATRQFALTAVAWHCWRKAIAFEADKADSRVEIGPDHDGFIAIRHIVTDPNGRHEIEPIRKWPAPADKDMEGKVMRVFVDKEMRYVEPASERPVMDYPLCQYSRHDKV